jgi:hypothetical protein
MREREGEGRESVTKKRREETEAGRRVEGEREGGRAEVEGEGEGGEGRAEDVPKL